MENNYYQDIRECYKDYMEWAAEVTKSMGGAKILAHLLSGGAGYRNHAEHDKFFSRCTEAAKGFTESFKAGEVDRELMLELLQFVLIDCYSICDERAEWMLLAAENNFVPLVEELDAAEAGSFFEPYRKLRRRNKGLPPQDAILKLLKKKK